VWVDSGPSGLMANGGVGADLHYAREQFMSRQHAAVLRHWVQDERVLLSVGNRATLIRGGITMAVPDPKVRAVF